MNRTGELFAKKSTVNDTVHIHLLLFRRGCFENELVEVYLYSNGNKNLKLLIK